MATDTIFPVSLSYRDAKGWIGTIKYHIANDSSIGTYLADARTVALAVQNAITAMTNAAFQYGSWPQTNVKTLVFGTNADYAMEWVKAVMTFSTDAGSFLRQKIPAPILGILETDRVTVVNDGTNALVTAYVNAMKTAVNSSFVSDRAGLPYTHFEGGIVRLGKQPRRFNGRIKSARLVAGEGE